MRRRASRSFIRLVVTFAALSLTCTLVAFYGSVSLINGQIDNQNTESKLPLAWRNPRAENRNPRQRETDFGYNEADSELHDRGRVLQGYAEAIIRRPGEGFRRANRRVDSVFSGPIQPLKPEVNQLRFYGCNEIRNIRIKEELGHGYTKFVQRGFLGGREVAVKSVQASSKDVQRCIGGNRTNKAECFNLIKYKLAKEIIILQQLKHNNIIKLLGFCWQNEVNSDDIKQRGLTMVTELGQPLDVLSMLQQPWQERLRICLGLARLIAFMENSPLGSLIIRDFRHPQFVLVSGEMKLSDLDDVDNEHRACSSHEQCIVGSVNGNRSLPCRNGLCSGFNAVFNMLNICRFFLDHILIPEAPRRFQPDLHDIMRKAQTLRLGSKALVARLENVVKRLRNGDHFVLVPGTLGKYKSFPQADFPALHDYYCDYSRQVNACEIAVGSLAEAQHQCTLDQQCKAFVVTKARTWIGHAIVYFKNNTTGIRHNKNTAAFIKVKS